MPAVRPWHILVVLTVALAAEQVGAYMGHQLAGWVELTLGWLPGRGLASDRIDDMAYQLFVQNLMLAAGAVGAMRGLGYTLSSMGIQRRAMWQGLILASPVVVLNAIAALSPAGPDGLTPTWVETLVYAAVMLAIGLGEEVFYRGALLSLLNPQRYPVLAVGLSAGMFGVAHVVEGFHIETSVKAIGSAIVVTFAIGVPFALIRLRTGSLLGLALAHAGYNMVAALDRHGLEPAPANHMVITIAVILAAVTCTLYIYWFRETGGFRLASTERQGAGPASRNE